MSAHEGYSLRQAKYLFKVSSITSSDTTTSIVRTRHLKARLRTKSTIDCDQPIRNHESSQGSFGHDELAALDHKLLLQVNREIGSLWKLTFLTEGDIYLLFH